MEEINYKIIQKARKEKKNLEGIKWISNPRNHKEPAYRSIILANWGGWKTSLWVKFKDGNNNIIFDSGVIEELNAEIQKYKEAKLEEGKV